MQIKVIQWEAATDKFTVQLSGEYEMTVLVSFVGGETQMDCINPFCPPAALEWAFDHIGQISETTLQWFDENIA